jgi:hypothetical protein
MILKIKPDFDAAWFNKSSAHALLSNKEESLGSLRKAVELNARYKNIAKNNPDFSKYREDADFQNIVR